MSFENFVQVLLSQPATADETTLHVAEAIAPYNLPPEHGGVLVLADSIGRPTFLEVVRYTSRAGSVLSGVERGAEGTAPRAWPAGSTVFMPLTAGGVDALRQSIDAKASVGSEAPFANGTASAGTSVTAARADHVHPLQTSVSGNAGTATKLAAARTINGVPFDGTADISFPVSSVGVGDVVQTARYEAGGLVQQQNSSFDTGRIRCVTASDVFAAAGDNGKLATSPDGINWTQQVSSFGTTTIFSIVWARSLFVAVGSSGKLATSPDGINWTQQVSSFGTTTIRWVTYSAGLFVAAGDSGKLATSPDGINWTQQVSGFGTTTINCVTWASGLFVAAGDSGKLATSPDGINWTQRVSSFGAYAIYSIAYGGGLFVAVGLFNKIATSHDGINWTPRVGGLSAGAVPQCLAYFGGAWVVGGSSGVLAVSRDGINWSRCASGFGSSSIRGSRATPSLLVMVGDNGKLAISTVPQFRTLAEGYSACDGSIYSQTEYSDLFAVLGARQDVEGGGYSYDPSTQFAVPNIPAVGGIGYFIRATP